jgi:hypothetical protein
VAISRGGQRRTHPDSEPFKGIATANRPLFTALLGHEWLAGVPDIHIRLSAPGAHGADLGCGLRWSTLAIARAYPDMPPH